MEGHFEEWFIHGEALAAAADNWGGGRFLWTDVQGLTKEYVVAWLSPEESVEAAERELGMNL